MDEARRFLRYVSPGLMFATEYAGLVILMLPDWALSILGSLRDDQALGLAFVLLVVSGGLGFIFSTVHHYLHWRCGWVSLDHTAAIRALITSKKLVVTEATTGKTVHAHAIRRRGAWVVATALWYERVERAPAIKGAERRTLSLTDLTHSLGAATVGSALALIAALVTVAAAGQYQIVIEAEPVIRWLAGFVLGLLILLGMVENTRRTAGLARDVVGQVLTSQITMESNKAGGAVKTFLVDS